MANVKERLGCTAVLLGGAVVLVLFVLAVARSVKSDHQSAPAASASAAAGLHEAPGTRALLDGIGVGDSVEGWRIENTRIDKHKRLRIDLQRGKTGFTVWVARKGGSSGKLAPRQSDKYELFVGEAREYGAPIPQGAEIKVLDALFKRVQRGEKHAPVPPGM